MIAIEVSKASSHGVHFTSQENACQAISSLSGSDIVVFDVDASVITNEEELFASLAAALRFPEYFGMNWDALDDCLRDLDWIPGAGYVGVVSSADRVWREHPQLAGRLVSSWLIAAEQWATDGKPFHLLFAW
jgi:hypothetical protein